jgi:hypothetical protein
VEKYEDGTVFMGTYLNGNKNGSGNITFANGNVIVGNFEKDFMEGDCKNYLIYKIEIVDCLRRAFLCGWESVQRVV